MSRNGIHSYICVVFGLFVMTSLITFTDAPRLWSSQSSAPRSLPVQPRQHIPGHRQYQLIFNCKVSWTLWVDWAIAYGVKSALSGWFSDVERYHGNFRRQWSNFWNNASARRVQRAQAHQLSLLIMLHSFLHDFAAGYQSSIVQFTTLQDADEAQSRSWITLMIFWTGDGKRDQAETVTSSAWISWRLASNRFCLTGLNVSRASALLSSWCHDMNLPDANVI